MCVFCVRVSFFLFFCGLVFVLLRVFVSLLSVRVFVCRFVCLFCFCLGVGRSCFGEVRFEVCVCFVCVLFPCFAALSLFGCVSVSLLSVCVCLHVCFVFCLGRFGLKCVCVFRVCVFLFSFFAALPLFGCVSVALLSVCVFACFFVLFLFGEVRSEVCVFFFGVCVSLLFPLLRPCLCLVAFSVSLLSVCVCACMFFKDLFVFG